MTATDPKDLLYYAIGYLQESLRPGVVSGLTPTQRIARAHKFILKLKQDIEDIKAGGSVEI